MAINVLPQHDPNFAIAKNVLGYILSTVPHKTTQDLASQVMSMSSFEELEQVIPALAQEKALIDARTNPDSPLRKTFETLLLLGGMGAESLEKANWTAFRNFVARENPALLQKA